MKRFTETHEWIEDGTVGVTDYAQKELGDVVYVELPEVGKHLKSGQEAVVLESTKAAADVYAPISGEVVEVNTALKEKPDLVNTHPEGEGWLYKIKVADETEGEGLLDHDSYQKLIQ